MPEEEEKSLSYFIARSFPFPISNCSLTLLITWLNPRAGKMTRILYSDWLPERAIWLDIGLFLLCVFSATSTSFRSAMYQNVACVACVQRGGERRAKGRGDWGEKERDSIPFPLCTFLRPPLPFHFLCLRT